LPEEYLNKLPKAIRDVINKAYNENKLSGELLKLTAETLKKQVIDNYTKAAIAYDQTDVNMLAQLVKNIWQFSAAKNYKEMKEITGLLKDGSGKLREYADFKQEVEKLGYRYNNIWMRTEYNFAVLASQNAARWTEFEKEADTIPNLKYQTMRDNVVRYEHAVLDGTVKPVNDSWWNRYYPPNGWGCRCEVVQSVDGAPVTTEPKEIALKPIFQTNLAKQGLIYPPKHNYFKDIPKTDLRNAILSLNPESTYTSLQLGDISIDVHPLHGDDELKGNLETCKMLLEHLKKEDEEAYKNTILKLLPNLNDTEDVFKNKFYSKEYIEKFGSKNADALFNERIVEFKEAKGGKQGIHNAVHRGKKQSDFIIIRVSDDANMEEIERQLIGRLNHYKDDANLIEVWVMNSNTLIKKQNREL
jgi:SPP1 gp7 family putative phage head morphogenesis protein